MKSIRFVLILAALSILPLGAQAQSDSATPKRAPRPDRVFIKDLEGVWINQSYLSALQATRSPRQAAAKSSPIVMQIKRDKSAYPILTTNFREAVLDFVVDVEPDVKPGSWRLVTAKTDSMVNSSDVTYTYFTGKRVQGGKFQKLEVREPHFAKSKRTAMANLGEPLEGFINRLTVAGKYKDGAGAAYEFTQDGEARLPDHKFAYEVLLYVGDTDCDLLASHHEKDPEGRELIGFHFKGDKLMLHKASKLSKNRWRCESQPFATLTRGDAA